MYFWQCPKCGTRLELRKRVTVTKRRCPHCNTLVTVQGIDHHTGEANRRHARNFLLLLLFLILGLPAIALLLIR
jgi:uncharacterized paraquat-inducible protein A